MTPKCTHKLFIIQIVMMVILSSCTASQPSLPVQSTPSPPPPPPTSIPTVTITPLPMPTATSTSIPFPSLSLPKGNNYFSIDDIPTFILSRNPTGKNATDFNTVLEWAHEGGTRIIRVHITHGWWSDPWINKDWSVNEKWAQNWDGFFDQAQAYGIYVIPVFAVWADWNDGTPDWGSPLWQYNPLNTANGGPVNAPGDLFVSGSATQNQWMQWVGTLVNRWQERQNIAGWEIFSELDIASGPENTMDINGAVDEAIGIEFTNKVMEVIHTSDTHDRPVTSSLSGVYSAAGKWASYYSLESLDFIEVHYYSDTIDRDLLKKIRQLQTTYNKPVLIGECGLWSMTHNANAPIGIKHAVWVGLVSGAMNSRALWDQDGYYIYAINNRASAMAFMETYATVELPVANFTSGVDVTNFQPLDSTFTFGVWGASIGNEKMVIGWYRDSLSEPPDWNLQPVITGQKVTITVPGTSTDWQVDFYDTMDGMRIVSTSSVSRVGNEITLLLPDFKDDIAFKMHSK